MKQQSAKLENRVLFYIMSFTWGSLMTVVGLVTLLVIYLFAYDKVYILPAYGRVRIHFKDNSFGGLSLGVVVLTSGGFGDDRILLHELGHTVQNARFGILFPILIGIPSAIRYHMFDWLKARYKRKHGKYLQYDSIWFEAQATRLGNAYFKER